MIDPKSLASLAFVLLVVSTLIGCSTPERTDGDDVIAAIPADWSSRDEDTARRDVPLDEWWTHFDDPDLGALIDEAFTHNPDVRGAAARVAQASAELDAAGALRWPEVGYSLDAQRSRQNFFGIDIPGQDVIQSTTTTFGASLTAQWEVDLWGRLSSNEEAALERYHSSVADAEAFLLSLSAQVTIAWFVLIESEGQYRLAVDVRDRLQATEERVQVRYREGLRDPLDLRLARSRRASSDADVAFADLRLTAARRALELLLGRYPASELAGRTSLPPLLEEVPVGVPAETLSRRPDLRAARAILHAAAADRDRTEAEIWPQLVLFGSGGTLSEELDDLLDGDFSVWSLAASLAGTLFDHGRRRSVADGAEARRLEAEAFFARAVLDACADVEAALRDENLLEVQEVRLKEFYAEADATRRLAEEQYSLGLADILELLSAERESALAESRVIAVERARLENRVRLLVALGGSIVPAEGDPTEVLTQTPDFEEGANP